MDPITPTNSVPPSPEPASSPAAAPQPTQSAPIGQSLFISIGIVIAGALVAGAIIWNGSRNPSPAQPGANPPAVQAADVSKVNTENEPFIGDPNASATMAYWTDYQCPFCQRNEEEVMPDIIKNYVDTGKLKIVFKDYPFLGPDSMTLAEYGRAVWAADPDKFYDWHKAVFDNQGEEGSGWATKEKIDSITTGVLGTNETTKVDALVTAHKADYDKAIEADKTEGSNMGVTGTPSFITGKELVIGALPYSQISSSVEDALSNK